MLGAAEGDESGGSETSGGAEGVTPGGGDDAAPAVLVELATGMDPGELLGTSVGWEGDACDHQGDQQRGNNRSAEAHGWRRAQPFRPVVAMLRMMKRCATTYSSRTGIVRTSAPAISLP